MLYSNAKKEALAIHERAVEKYNVLYEDFQRRGEQLYTMRKSSIAKIIEVEVLINSIANTPKEFGAKLVEMKAERTAFRQTEEYAAEAYKTAIKSGVGTVAGAGAGAAVASLAPTAAMWVATTFGTASTGTAISALSGAAATKAALAWLGGGALAAGGGGVAAGKAILALAGPIGWGIGAGATAISATVIGVKNKKISKQAIEEAKEITIAGAKLHEAEAIIAQIYDKTELLYTNVKEQLLQASSSRGADYQSLPSERKLLLGTLVNNTTSLAQLLNETV